MFLVLKLNHRRSRRLEKVRPGTWSGCEEEGKRSRMWTHEDELDREVGADLLDREMGADLTQPLAVPT